MIRLKYLNYPAFDLTRVHMDAGERYAIAAADNDRSLGVWCVLGGCSHGADPAPPVHLPQAGEGLLLNDAASGWSNAAVGHHALELHAVVETEWVCLSENGSGRPALTGAIVDSELALEPGTGVVVVSGALSLDGVPGRPDAWFRPRQALARLTGSGEAILVTLGRQGAANR